MLLDYRKDIDGLRTIAVMLVVLFHAKLPVSGGFVGVDVFFVISGFLIASLIQKQILRGKFTFKGFYLHRMRRILPALLAVIFTTFMVSWFLLMPDDLIFLVRSTIMSLISFSNFFFLSKLQDYFSADVDTAQLVHTWSLSVEEQFYLFVPIFLILLFKYFYKTKWFNYILFGTLIFSFVVSHTMAYYMPLSSYYLLPTRFFELFMGVVLALNYQNIPVLESKYKRELLGAVGLLLILIPAFCLQTTSVFPGINAFYVCLGTSILIYLGKSEDKTVVTKILSTKPFMWIGLISYSLYLWHWVVFSTLNIASIELTTLDKLGVILFLIGVSFISWKFIEQPFRKTFKWGFLKTFIVLLMMPILFFIGIKVLVKKRDFAASLRFSEDIVMDLKGYNRNTEERNKYCHNAIFNNKEQSKAICTIGDNKKNPKILLFGDSHSNSAEGLMEVLMKDSGLSAYAMTNDSATYFVNSDASKIVYSDEFTEKDINKFFQILEKEIINGNYKYIVFTGRFSFYEKAYGKENFHKMFVDTVELLNSTGAIPVILTDSPELIKNSYCLTYNKLLGTNHECRLSYNDYLKQTKTFRSIYREIEEKFPRAIIIDQNKIICDSDFCKIEMGGEKMYFDSNHLTVRASRRVGEEYLKRFGNPFEKNIAEK